MAEKQRPIILNTDMVKAILDGRKAQTRRPMKPQPTKSDNTDGYWWPSNVVQSMVEVEDMLQNKHREGIWRGLIHDVNPFGEPGNLLYVRETFGFTKYDELCFRADGEEFENADGWIEEPKWKPSIHMPKEYARIWLKIKDVRVERVQSISQVDAISEGSLTVETELVYPGYKKLADEASKNGDKPPIGPCPVDRFKFLWDSIYENGEYNWGSNPWVWVVEFELIEK